MYSTKKSVERILQIYKKEIRRQISKTTSVTNSDAMVPRLDQANTSVQNDDMPKKLLKLQKYHRSVNSSNRRSLRNYGSRIMHGLHVPLHVNAHCNTSTVLVLQL